MKTAVRYTGEASKITARVTAELSAKRKVARHNAVICRNEQQFEIGNLGAREPEPLTWA